MFLAQGSVFNLKVAEIFCNTKTVIILSLGLLRVSLLLNLFF